MSRKTVIRLLPWILSAALQAQTTVNTTVGGSQLYDVYGVKSGFKWGQVAGWAGLGYNGGLSEGGYLQLPVRKTVHVGLGDQALSSFLDTDEYDNHIFYLRGASFDQGLVDPDTERSTGKSDSNRVQVFSGWLSRDFEYPFLHVSSTDDGSLMKQTAITGLIAQSKLGDSVQVHSVALWDGKFTSIGSIGWTPSKRWKFAGAGGAGSGAPYLAGRGEFHVPTIDIGTSYTIAGNSFHRQEQSNYSAEPLGWNARFAWAPGRPIKLVLDREHERTYLNSLPAVTSTVASASLFATVKGFQFNPSISTVSTSSFDGRTLTDMFSAQRQILHRWRSFGAYIHMDSPSFKYQTYVATNEFRVNSRLAIRQNFNRINGSNSFTGGMTWMSNLLSFSLDNQLYVSPLAASFGGKSVFQSWTFSIRLRTPHGTSTNLNTFVNPQGRVEWGGYLAGLRYSAVGGSSNATPTFSKFVIHGKVVDESGKGVWGIAVQVGAEMVYSDTQGEFFLHVKSSRPLPFAVAADASLLSSWWKLQSAPPFAQGRPEGSSGDPLLVVVQTTRTMASAQ